MATDNSRRVNLNNGMFANEFWYRSLYRLLFSRIFSPTERNSQNELWTLNGWKGAGMGWTNIDITTTAQLADLMSRKLLGQNSSGGSEDKNCVEFKLSFAVHYSRCKYSPFSCTEAHYQRLTFLPFVRSHLKWFRMLIGKDNFQFFHDVNIAFFMNHFC